jgi:hypothetical protein
MSDLNLAESMEDAEEHTIYLKGTYDGGAVPGLPSVDTDAGAGAEADGGPDGTASPVHTPRPPSLGAPRSSVSPGSGGRRLETGGGAAAAAAPIFMYGKVFARTAT